MKRNKKQQQMARYLSVFCICVMYLSMLRIPVKAEEKSVTVKIPVSCIGTNTTERFTYELEGGDSEYEQVEAKQLTLSDGEEGSFSITYNYPGTYQYTVHQEAGNDEETTYDDTVYQIDVYVTENDAGELGITPVAYVEGETEKREILSYHNSKELQPEEPTKPEEPAKGSVSVTEERIAEEPKTGDEGRLFIWMAVSAAAFGTLVILGKTRRDQRGKEDA